MPARVGAYQFVGKKDELECIKDIPKNTQLRPGDEMIICFRENPKTWDAVVAMVNDPGNGNCTVAVIDTNWEKGIRCPKETIFLQIDKRQLFVPKIFFNREEKKENDCSDF